MRLQIKVATCINGLNGNFHFSRNEKDVFKIFVFDFFSKLKKSDSHYKSRIKSTLIDTYKLLA